MWRALFSLCVIVALPARAADLGGHARLWGGPGFDTNATRDFVSAGRATSPDAFAYGLVSLDGSALWERVALSGAYDVAGRKFLTQPAQDTIVQNAQLDLDLTLSRAFSLGVTTRARDRRGADRDYSDFNAGALLTFVPDPALEASIEVDAERFIFWPRFSYSYSGPAGTLRVKYRINKRHGLNVNGYYMARKYNAQTNDNPNLDEQMPVLRRDSVFSAGAGWSYKGPFQLSIGYTYFEQASNSYGESLRRHRLQVTAGFLLPWDLTLLGSGALQLSQFPDKIFLSPDLQVIDDEENSSFVALKLVKSIHKNVDLDLRYAFYLNVLPQAEFLYTRHVITVGVGAHF